MSLQQQDPARDGRGWPGFFSTLTRRLLGARAVTAILVVLVTAFFAYGSSFVRLDASNENWFVEGDRSLELINRFKAVFGNDDFVYVLFETDDFFRPEEIAKLDALARDLDAAVPYVSDITWLGNAEFIEGRQESVEIEELMPALPETLEEARRIRAKAMGETIYVDSLISRDGKVAGLLMEMAPYPDDVVDPRKKVAPAVRSVLAKPEYAGLNLHAVGNPLMDYDLDVITAEETGLLLSACLLVQMAILVWVTGGVRGVVVPLSVVLLGLVWTFGVVGFSGFALNVMVIMVPVLLVCVGIGNSMHIIAEFQDWRARGLQRRAAVARAIATVGLPCMLTTMTTAAGFLSFLFTSIKPVREMGMYAATGVVMTLILTFLVVPIAYSLGRDESETHGETGSNETEVTRNDVFDRLLARIHLLVMGYPRTLVVLFSAIFFLSVLGASRVVIESRSVKMLSTKIPIRQAYDYVDARMGGSMSIEIMLDTGEKEGVIAPDFLTKMEALEQFVDAHPSTTKVTSILDVLRRMRRAFNENREEFYSLPTSREEAFQYLLLYEMSGGSDKDKLLSYDYDVARLTARTRSLDTGSARAFVAEVEEFAENHVGEAAEVQLTGLLTWVTAMTDLIGEGQKVSFTAAFLVITAIMIVLMRSVRLGLISMIPNVFPVVIGLGLMGFAGIYMDIGAMTFGAIIIGVAVDDTIHFFVRYREEFERSGNYSVALRRTLATVGRPIAFTTMTLTVGFSVLLLSEVSGLFYFGVLAGFAFTWALLADFFFAPALLVLLQTLGPERSED